MPQLLAYFKEEPIALADELMSSVRERKESRMTFKLSSLVVGRIELPSAEMRKPGVSRRGMNGSCGVGHVKFEMSCRWSRGNGG